MQDQDLKAISEELRRCGSGVFVSSPFSPLVECLIRQCERGQKRDRHHSGR